MRRGGRWCSSAGRAVHNFNDTWVWDGTNWVQEVTRPRPPRRAADHAMAYDAARGQVVLFGGGGSQLNDTWVWDGSNWVRSFQALRHRKSVNGSQPRMAYDAKPEVFSSVRTQIQAHPLPWVWDGSRWVQRNSRPLVRQSVSPRYGLRCGAWAGGAVRGIDRHSYVNDTWVWDGSNWVQKFPLQSPARAQVTPWPMTRRGGRWCCSGGTTVSNGCFERHLGLGWLQLDPEVPGPQSPGALGSRHGL
jgi:hypothetical protein